MKGKHGVAFARQRENEALMRARHAEAECTRLERELRSAKQTVERLNTAVAAMEQETGRLRREAADATNPALEHLRQELRDQTTATKEVLRLVSRGARDMVLTGEQWTRIRELLGSEAVQILLGPASRSQRRSLKQSAGRYRELLDDFNGDGT